MNIVEKIDTTWEEFVSNNDVDNTKYIYRGHTNSISNTNFSEWKLISLFNRFYTNSNFKFRQFLSQQLEENLFQSTYGKYKCLENKNLANSNTITKLYYLQHYGVPTCLLDFTYNPLIALYFAITNLKGHSGGEYDLDTGIPKFYNNEYYISIYKIDYNQLTTKLNLKNLEHTDNKLFLNYDYYGINFYRNQKRAFVALDLNPKETLKSSENYNLENQSSCFILYDNYETQDLGFEEFIEYYAKENNLNCETPLIQIYNIKYNSVFKLRPNRPNSISLFEFLKSKGISGSNLFNDFQGLKYDFNFFHER